MMILFDATYSETEVGALKQYLIAGAIAPARSPQFESAYSLLQIHVLLNF